MKKLTALILALILALSLSLPTLAAETDEFVYVAFGDSIAAGYGLADYDITADTSMMSYVRYLAGDSTLFNFAQSGMNSTELLEYLNDADALAALKNAELVTVSIGGNDLILPLLQALLPGVDLDSLKLGELMAGGEMPDILAMAESLGLTDVSKLIPAVMTVVGNLPDIIATYSANLTAIVTAIQTAAPNAKVVLQTVYNPYKGCTKLVAYETYLDAIMSTLNNAVKSVATEKGCVLADVYSAFDESGEVLLNSAVDETFFDPHPNVVGHALIALTVHGAATAAGVEMPVMRPFVDILPSGALFDATSEMAADGLMKGMADGYFDADGSLTRAQVVTMLYRMAGSPDFTGSSAFDDVAKGDWYFAAVNWGAKEGYVTGYGDGKFGPKDLVTREQLAVILYRYLSAVAPRSMPSQEFPPLASADGADVHDWAVDAVKWAVDMGAYTATGAGLLRPTASASRGDAAVLFASAK